MIDLGIRLVFCVTIPVLIGFVAGYVFCHLMRARAARRRRG